MKIARVVAFPVRMAPTVLSAGSGAYRWSSVHPCLYSVNFETALLGLTTDTGLVGWGEAQAPLGPEVACGIVRLLLAPVMEGEGFEGTREEIELWWNRMYSTVRVRGQTGGFMLDAISGVDMALWDLPGKIRRRPLCALLAESPQSLLPAYLSGLPEEASRRETARQFADQGFRQFKLFFDTPGEREFWARFDDMPESSSVAADALWRLNSKSVDAFAREAERRNALWLEAPFPPEEHTLVARLKETVRVPIAVGKSYRTEWEMAPYFAIPVGIFQPDFGRCGLTGGMRMAQIAAAIHYTAAVHCPLTEYNPQVFAVANRFLLEPLRIDGNCYQVPTEPGLGIERNEEALARLS